MEDYHAEADAISAWEIIDFSPDSDDLQALNFRRIALWMADQSNAPSTKLFMNQENLFVQFGEKPAATFGYSGPRD